jgi:hypothetical protein
MVKTINALTIGSIIAFGSRLTGSAIITVIAIFSVQTRLAYFSWKTFFFKSKLIILYPLILGR